MPACTASLARWKTDMVASPWMASPMRRPPWRSTARSTTSRCSASRPGAVSGSSCHSRVEATTSVARKVTTPVGNGSLSQPARSSSTSSPGVAVRCAGSMARPRRSACSSRAARWRSMSLQAGKDPRRRLPGQQGEGGRRQAVDVGRPGRDCASGHFRRPVARRTPTGTQPPRRRHPEVDQHDPSRRGQHQVGRLDITMDDGRVGRVQVGEGLGDRRQPAQDRRRRQPRLTVLGQAPPPGRRRRPSPSPARGGRPRRSHPGPAAGPDAGASDSSVRDSTSSRSASRGSAGTRRSLSATSRP